MKCTHRELGDFRKGLFTEGGLFGKDQCGDEAAFQTIFGPRCTTHAESVRRALRDPKTLINVKRERTATEAEIARLVRPIQ